MEFYFDMHALLSVGRWVVEHAIEGPGTFSRVADADKCTYGLRIFINKSLGMFRCKE